MERIKDTVIDILAGVIFAGIIMGALLLGNACGQAPAQSETACIEAEVITTATASIEKTEQEIITTATAVIEKADLVERGK